MSCFAKGLINPQLEYGPIACAYFQGIQMELGFNASGIAPSRHLAVLDYLYNLSIETANSYGIVGSGELAGIGQLIGYPWPSVYASDFGNNFQFIPASAFPGTNRFIGFSSIASGITYGLFTSANPAQNGKFVDLSVYRKY